MKFVKRQIVLSTLLVCTGMGVTGCWDSKDVGEITMVSGLGIDQTDDGSVSVTAQILNPLALPAGIGQKSQSDPYQNIQGVGPTISHAFDDLQRQLPRTLFYQHNSIVIFGDAYAQQGIGRALDYFQRHPEFQVYQLFYVSRGSASSMMKTDFPVENINSRGIRDLVLEENNSHITVPSTMNDVSNELIEPSSTPALAVVGLSRMGHPQLDGIAVFQQDKLHKILGAQESNDLAWFLGNVNHALITVPCEHEANDGQSHVISNLINVLSSRTQIRVLTDKDGRIRFQIRVRGTGEVADLCREAKFDEKSLTSLESKMGNTVRSQMRSSAESLQSEKIDALHLGTVLYEQKPKLWQQVKDHWPETYSHVPIKYDIQFHLLRGGRLSNSFSGKQTSDSQLPLRGRLP